MTDWADDDYDETGIEAQPVDVDDEPAASDAGEVAEQPPALYYGSVDESCASTCAMSTAAGSLAAAAPGCGGPASGGSTTKP
ncbi:hypothetical protein [Isoptericola croceus]|uniref:hypothetical protein n=1 Tax=Isoptericola croceus TaxID=3031406 RepID=UPI0023F9A372|nr:hypothetical protein [Isoptericola croceus]